uniref:WD_REPEATS_REGION domain-containing protein n=1 Tax=Schistosoma mansoni TaxID=6183 RepID=A0A5K4FAD5_SCHMA
MTQEFTDEIVHGVQCYSQCPETKSFAELQMQTESYKVFHRGTQSKRYKTQELQTDFCYQDEAVHNDILTDRDKLTEETRILCFLKRTEPIITKEIQKNIHSKVFRRSQSRRLFYRNNAAVKNTLILNEAKESKLSVTGLSWNSNGTLLAISYGSLCHTDWCTHNGIAALWNVSNEISVLNTPKQKYVTDTCLMCIKFHPIVPSLLAGGTFTGDLVVWNRANENDHLLASIGSMHSGHKDCINQISWISDSLESDLQNLTSDKISRYTTTYQLLSSGSDGRIICWRIDLRHSGKVNCVKIFQIRHKDQSPLAISNHFNSLKKCSLLRSDLSETINSDRAVNITCISLAKNDSEKFVVGTETGGLLICQLNSVNWNETYEESLEEHLQSPVKFSLARQDGPIYSVDWSKFYPNLILSCGFNHCIQLYNVLQKSPLLSIDPNNASVRVVEFSSYLPNIFICINEYNHILIYDLTGDEEINPIYKRSNEEKLYSFQPELLYTLTSQVDDDIQSTIVSAKLNEKDSKLVATGNTDGIAYVWDFGNLINELPLKVINT